MELRYSRRFVLKFLAFSSVSAAACYGYVGYYAKHISYSPFFYGMACLALVIYLPLTILWLALLFRQGVAVELTPEGIKRRKWPLIRWEQISRLRSMRLGFADMLIIHPGEGFPESIKLDPDGTASFGLSNLTPGSREVFAWLDAHRPDLVSASR